MSVVPSESPFRGVLMLLHILQEDALDTLLYLRLTLALAAGIACGVTQSQGLYVFLG